MNIDNKREYFINKVKSLSLLSNITLKTILEILKELN